MEEKDVLAHAKEYIDSMAKGLNPLTGEKVPDTDVINNVRISRCLFYVSGVLQKVINGYTDVKKEKIKVKPFEITQEELKSFAFSKVGITAKQLREKLGDLIDKSVYKQLSYNAIYDWLIQIGAIEYYLDEGKRRKRPTVQGNQLGILTEIKKSEKYGDYSIMVFDINAQHFIVDNIGALIQIEQAKEKHHTWASWTKGHEECLAELIKQNVPMREIAATLKRTEKAVIYKAKLMGLI